MGALRPRFSRVNSSTPALVKPASNLVDRGQRRGYIRSPGENGRRGVVVRSAVNQADPDTRPHQMYDYIVVGGGTAGCILANRLTEKGDKRVLVLEAGPIDTGINVTLPAGITRLFKSALDWNLFSEQQRPLADREIYLARGKLLGGSSCTNATLYHRGTAEDYRSWNIEGWGPDDVLEWFKKSEDNARGASEYHGTGGVMCVEDPRYRNRLHKLYFEAAEDLGFKHNPDFNDWSHSQEGYGDFQVTQHQGLRADMFSRCLRPIMKKRSNLKVETNKSVTKIVIDKENGMFKSNGVMYAEGQDSPQTFGGLAPGGEILLCAGAVHSPHILMLSGVGPSAALGRCGIETICDSPGVGKNLQDHPAVVSAFRLKPEYSDWSMTSNVYNKRGNIRKRAILNFLFRRRGPLTTTGCDRGAFVATSGSGQPDLQMRFAAGFALDPDGVGSYVKFAELTRRGESWPGGLTYQLIACRPKSTGSIGLKSNDPFDDPSIDPGFLSDPKGEDRATLRAGLRLSRKMAASEKLAPYLWFEGFPGPSIQSDDDLDNYISNTMHSANALVGSCRMGPSRDKNAVVGPDLKVHGVDGLRVVDASVMPVIPGGQTGATTAMIAERTAQMMLERAASPA